MNQLINKLDDNDVDFTSKAWKLKEVPLKKQIYKLKKNLVKLHKESILRDNQINEILQCTTKENSEMKEETNEEYHKNVCQAELIVSYVRATTAQNDLVIQKLETETQMHSVKSLTKDKNVLQEINAKQKVAIEMLKEEIIDFRKSRDHYENSIQIHQQTISDLKKGIENLKDHIEIQDFKHSNINYDLEKAEETSIKSKGELENIVASVSDGEGLVDVDSAIQKIKFILNENKAMKTHIQFFEKQINSFKCEQELSRETINRLAKEVEIERLKRIDCIGKISELTEKLLVNSENETLVNKHITCLGNQLSEMREFLANSMQENLDKSILISQLENQNKVLVPFSDFIESLDSFIITAEDIISNDQKVNTDEAMFLIQCVKKLNAILKPSNSD